jgi:hypothetical protein
MLSSLMSIYWIISENSLYRWKEKNFYLSEFMFRSIFFSLIITLYACDQSLCPSAGLFEKTHSIGRKLTIIFSRYLCLVQYFSVRSPNRCMLSSLMSIYWTISDNSLYWHKVINYFQSVFMLNSIYCN